VGCGSSTSTKNVSSNHCFDIPRLEGKIMSEIVIIDLAISFLIVMRNVGSP
jgi:hypothetical protein